MTVHDLRRLEEAGDPFTTPGAELGLTIAEAAGTVAHDVRHGRHPGPARSYDRAVRSMRSLQHARLDLVQIREGGSAHSGPLAELDELGGLEERPGRLMRRPFAEVDHETGITRVTEDLVGPLPRSSPDAGCIIEDRLPGWIVRDVVRDQDVRHDGIVPQSEEPPSRAGDESHRRRLSSSRRHMAGRVHQNHVTEEMDRE